MPWLLDKENNVGPLKYLCRPFLCLTVCRKDQPLAEEQQGALFQVFKSQ
jgi:hypothetical protein